MSREMIVPEKNLKTLQGLLNSRKEKLSTLLPTAIEPARLVNIIMMAVLGNERLMVSTPESIYKAAAEASQLGLLVDRNLGWAYLVPYWNSDTGRYEANLQLGYRGLIHLATRGDGPVRKVWARVVHEQDLFEVMQGTDERIRHEVDWTLKDRGRRIAAYAVAEFRDGSLQFDVAAQAEIETIKDAVARKNRGLTPMWTQYESEGWKKSIARRLCKYLPLAPDALVPIGADEARELAFDKPGDSMVVDIEGEVVQDATEAPQGATESAAGAIRGAMGDYDDEADEEPLTPEEGDNDEPPQEKDVPAPEQEAPSDKTLPFRLRIEQGTGNDEGLAVGYLMLDDEIVAESKRPDAGSVKRYLQYRAKAVAGRDQYTIKVDPGPDMAQEPADDTPDDSNSLPL